MVDRGLQGFDGKKPLKWLSMLYTFKSDRGGTALGIATQVPFGLSTETQSAVIKVSIMKVNSSHKSYLENAWRGRGLLVVKLPG